MWNIEQWYRCLRLLTFPWLTGHRITSLGETHLTTPGVDFTLAEPWKGQILMWCCSVAQSCPSLCDLMNCSTPGFPGIQFPLKFVQTYVHWVDDAIQPCHPLSPTCLPALSISQHQGLLKWVSSLHQVAKVLELQVQWTFQWTSRTDLL